MMKIGYFSPFSPDPSGISDFSEELVLQLKKHLDLEIFARISPKNEDIQRNFVIHTFEDIENEDVRQQFDYLLYQVGNNRKYHKGVIEAFLKYPGILELHDFSLHHYLAEDTFAQNNIDAYVDIMTYCHGKKGEKAARDFLEGRIGAPWENRSNEFTVNKHLIDRALAVIVHSDMAKQMVKGIRSDVPVINIPLHTTEIKEDYLEFKVECRNKIGISKDVLVMGSFGYATVAKRIMQILEALALYKKRTDKRFLYYIVGQVQNLNIKEKLRELGLENNVIVTGFTTMEDFKMYMGACDFCFNLRYPTQGESSASLHRMLGFGKPILVTDIGTFEEYPDDIVMKIRFDENEIQDIYNAIDVLVSNSETLASRSCKAYLYAKKNCDLKINARKYADFLQDLKCAKVEDEFLDKVVDYIFELKLNNQEYVEYFLNKYSRYLEIFSEEEATIF